MEITVERLLQMVGELTVKVRLLEEQLAAEKQGREIEIARALQKEAAKK